MREVPPAACDCDARRYDCARSTALKWINSTPRGHYSDVCVVRCGDWEERESLVQCDGMETWRRGGVLTECLNERRIRPVRSLPIISKGSLLMKQVEEETDGKPDLPGNSRDARTVAVYK